MIGPTFAIAPKRRLMTTAVHQHALATLVLSLALAAALPACGKQTPPAADSTPGSPASVAKVVPADEVTLTAETMARYGLTVEAAQKAVLLPTIAVPARVGFNTEAMAHVGSPLRGRVVEIKVRVGQEVKSGDELGSIESPELGEAQADLLQKRVTKDSAGPAVDLAKVAWDRAKGLHEQSQGISLTEVQRREAEFKAAVAAQRAAEAAVTASENRLRLMGMGQAAVDAFLLTGKLAPRHTLRAPIDGQVIERKLTIGELVGPDRESLVVLADLTDVWVVADVPEAHVCEVAVKAKAWVSVGPCSAPMEARVEHVSASVDMNTRTAQVRIALATNGLPIKPGMFAQVEISVGGESTGPVVAVPEIAVQTIEGATVVFVPVRDTPGTFAKRPVSVGRSVGGLMPVHSGLAEGEKFVSAGSFILKADLVKD